MLDQSAPRRADISGLLGQVVVPPWAREHSPEGGTAGQGPADDRPVEAIAAEIAGAAPVGDEGDGSTPPAPQALRQLVEAITAAGTAAPDGGWLGGIREYIPDSGPVPSSRFL